MKRYGGIIKEYNITSSEILEKSNQGIELKFYSNG